MCSRLASDFKARLARYRQKQFTRDTIYLYLNIEFAELIRTGYPIRTIEIGWNLACFDSNFIGVGTLPLSTIQAEIRAARKMQWYGSNSNNGGGNSNNGGSWNQGGGNSNIGGGRNKWSQNSQGWGDDDGEERGRANKKRKNQNTSDPVHGIINEFGNVIRTEYAKAESDKAVSMVRELFAPGIKLNPSPSQSMASASSGSPESQQAQPSQQCFRCLGIDHWTIDCKVQYRPPWSDDMRLPEMPTLNRTQRMAQIAQMQLETVLL